MLARSNWKYIILFLLFLGWSLGNLDRFIINYAILDISKDLHLNASSTGIILSSFCRICTDANTWWVASRPLWV